MPSAWCGRRWCKSVSSLRRRGRHAGWSRSDAMHALFFHRADHAFDHPVLLRAVRRDELLAQPIVSHQRGVAARGEDQPVIGSQQERRRHASQSPEAGDQGMSQCAAAVQALPLADLPAHQLEYARHGVLVEPPTDARPSGSQRMGTLRTDARTVCARPTGWPATRSLYPACHRRPTVLPPKATDRANGSPRPPWPCPG